MSRCKICPTCGEQNDPRSMECMSCSTDLMGISIIDTDEQVKKQEDESEKTESSSNGEQPKYVRVCTCGEVNPVQMRKCQKCSEDLSDIVPTAQEEINEKKYQLSEIGGSYVYPIPVGNIVIGREHGMRECLCGKQFVSRVHAKLSTEDGKLYIENLSGTNYTYVNNIKIPSGKVQLNAGDELALGGIVINGRRQEEAAYFLVGLSV